jgi:hypothetical protein
MPRHRVTKVGFGWRDLELPLIVWGLYVAAGNGSVGVTGNPADVTNRSESALKLTPSGSTLTVSSFFTPTNYLELEATDLDFGVTGLLLIPEPTGQ